MDMTQFCENENCTNKNPNEPTYCCNAFDCECRGEPVPYFCSGECYEFKTSSVEIIRDTQTPFESEIVRVPKGLD